MSDDPQQIAPIPDAPWEEVHCDDGTVILRWSWRIDLENPDRMAR